MPAAAQDASPAPDPDASQWPWPSPGRSPTPGPGAAEVALCEEEGSALLAGEASRPLIASRAGSDVPSMDTRVLAQLDASRPGSAGCRAPTSPVDNPFGDGTLDLFAISDAGGDGPLDIERTRWGEVELTACGGARA